MENRVQDELQLGAASAEDGVEPARRGAEDLLRLGLDHPHAHEQPDGQRDARRRHDRRKRVLAQRPVDDQRKRHRRRLVDRREIPHPPELGEGALVVAHEQKGGAVFPADLADQLQGLAGAATVEVARRFVGQDELRMVGQRAGHGDALLLAGGELPGKMPQAGPEPDPPEHVPRVGPVGSAAERHAQDHVLEDRVALEQVEGLENVAELLGAHPVAAGLGKFRDVHAVDLDPALVRRQDAGDQVQERRLARTAFAAQRKLLARVQPELRDAHDLDAPALGRIERLAQVGDGEHRAKLDRKPIFSEPISTGPPAPGRPAEARLPRAAVLPPVGTGKAGSWGGAAQDDRPAPVPARADALNAVGKHGVENLELPDAAGGDPKPGRRRRRPVPVDRG